MLSQNWRSLSATPAQRFVLALFCSLALVPVASAGFCQQMPAPAGSTTTDGSADPEEVAYSDDLLVVQLKDGTDRDKFDETLQEVHGTVYKTLNAGPSLQFLLIQCEKGKAADVERKLSRDKNVKSVERNLRFSHSFHPNDPVFPYQWDWRADDDGQVRNDPRLLGLIRQAGVFYELDSGCTNFPGELADHCTQISAFTLTPEAVHDVDSKDSHGTAVASISATTNNGVGIAGVCNLRDGNDIYLYIYRITKPSSGGSTTLTAILSALTDAAKRTLPPGPINLSYGNSSGPSLYSLPSIQAIGQQLETTGKKLIVASGNSSANDPAPEMPSEDAPYVRRVSAIGQGGNLAFYSNFGPFHAAAPGSHLPMYTRTGEISAYYGTSFAAPRWAGYIMLLMQCGVRTAHEADRIIYQTANVNSQGWRSPNIRAAFSQIAGSP
jgi:hypothetical protein